MLGIHYHTMNKRGGCHCNQRTQRRLNRPQYETDVIITLNITNSKYDQIASCRGHSHPPIQQTVVAQILSLPRLHLTLLRGPARVRLIRLHGATRNGLRLRLPSRGSFANDNIRRHQRLVSDLAEETSSFQPLSYIDNDLTSKEIVAAEKP